MKYEITPFQSVGNIKLDFSRDFINKNILNNINYTSQENKNINTGEISTNDYFDNGIILAYMNKDYILQCIVLNDPCEAIFNGIDLLNLSYINCLNYLKNFDPDIEEEEYVGFTSYNLGIAIYAPNAIDDKNTFIECITIGRSGYF
ncbi:hypothetical protein SAMN05660772_02784 [Pasteurella testudinis DSM 23072]|uniref:Uncharacterized protein n=1 Tax=Pasteurella testudinis DSM 23072 TaxID=1122938 RepID=A0A1W1V3S3_9PAST|nr:hypothetical protein [Pasteurella testudinis]SMB87958.1 hypothetical protein SAMN05660772_02784 [Pasteurella testudinis DSM 23072]SUB52180.1 Uncharacterised protein [Pasteurella testudinis]